MVKLSCDLKIKESKLAIAKASLDIGKEDDPNFVVEEIFEKDVNGQDPLGQGNSDNKSNSKIEKK